MTELKNNLSTIDRFVPPGSKIIYLDIPLHLNVGDILIYKGTENFFRERNYTVLARRTDKTSLAYIEKLTNVDSDVIFLLHGGGNFGDLYPHHQLLRERVVELFPNNKIVYMPQTVHFKDEQKLQASSEIISRHNNLIIFCRDIKSYGILKDKFSDKVYLCPDMAHSLWSVFPKQKKSDLKRNTLWMIRNDIEKTSLKGFVNAPSASEYRDWDDICSNLDRFVMKSLSKFERINNRIGTNIFPTVKLWDSYTDSLVARVNDYFLQHKEVITSRMHGHILCCLLDIDTKLIDNSYGKNSSYYNEWTNKVEKCNLVEL